MITPLMNLSTWSCNEICLVPCFASFMNTMTEYLLTISSHLPGLPLLGQLDSKLFSLVTLCLGFELVECKSASLRWMILFRLMVPIALWRNCKIRKCLFDFAHFLDARLRTYADCRFLFKSLEVGRALG